MTQERCSKYGEYLSIYTANAKWFSILESMNTQGVTFGYFGESLRTLGNLEAFCKKHYSLRDMIRDFHFRDNFEKTGLTTDTIYDTIESEYIPLMTKGARQITSYP